MATKPRILDLIRLLPSGDLARAAQALGLDSDALMKRVGSFENALGTKLIDRAAKVLKPGEAGRLVIDHASRFFSQARDLTRDLEELAGLQAPEIVLGADMFAAELPLGVTLGRMATANSRLRVQVVVGSFDSLVADVLAGKLEFAIADTTGAERHTSKLAIQPVAEHRMFFFARHDHPLTKARDLVLEAILAAPLVAPRVPQRVAVHVAKAMPLAKVDRDTGDLNPNIMLDSFAVARAVVMAGNAISIAPLTAIENELRSGRLALIPFEAPWLHMSYGLFYPRKKALSRASQLFVVQLRQVETAIQEREQRAIARMSVKRRPRKTTKRAQATRTAARRRTRVARSR